MGAVEWKALADDVPRDARRDAQYIFHIGNVGSTLISRLLGELPGVLALREPLLLRAFAEMLGPVSPPSPWVDTDGRLAPLTALLSRTFRPDQRATDKSTSLSSEHPPSPIPSPSHTLSTPHT